MNITDNQFRAVQELITIMRKYDIQFRSDDPYCGVEVDIGEKNNLLVLNADLASLENWLEAYEEFI